MTRSQTKPTQATTATPRERWLALHTSLSRNTATAAATWARRSPATSRWRALPAGVSAISPYMASATSVAIA